MRVTTLKQGYFGRLREPGEMFDVPDEATATWFAPLHDDMPEADEDDNPTPQKRSRKSADAPAGEAT